MRPDWGTRQAVAGRVRFAEHRMRLSLPQVCLHAVTAALTPNSPPDAFIRVTPADPKHISATVAQLRRRLLQVDTTHPNLAAPASGADVAGSDTATPRAHAQNGSRSGQNDLTQCNAGNRWRTG